MSQAQTLLTSLALAVSLVLVSSVASAQRSRRMFEAESVTETRSPDMMINPSASQAHAPLPAAFATPVGGASGGVIRTVVRSDDGRPQTLILESGIAISLPPRMARALAIRGVNAGERIVVAAFVAGLNPGSMRAQTLKFPDGAAFYAYGR